MRPQPVRRASSRDAGMSLVEAMVALVLFAVLTSAILVTVVRSSRLTHEDAARVAATNLAVREIEIIRDTFSGVTRGPDRVKLAATNASPLPGGEVDQPLVVDGTRFTVRRTSTWKQLGDTGSACDQATNVELSYLEVAIKVSWQSQGRERSVKMGTTMTPAKGTYSLITGHIGLKVVDRDGQPVEDVNVTASGPLTKSGTTAEDGCVLIAFLTPGAYELKLNEPGYVLSGDPEAKPTANVVEGQLWRGTLEYDKAAAIDTTFTTQSGWSLPPSSSTGIDQIPITIGNSALTPNGSRPRSGTGVTRTLSNLFPYLSGYQLWAGNCVDSDPGDFRAAPVAAEPPPEPSASTEVALAPLTVKVPGSLLPTITATHAADSACPGGMTVSLGAMLAGGELRTSLPYGKWTIRRSGSSTTKTVTLVAPDPENPVTPPPTPPVVSW